MNLKILDNDSEQLVSLERKIYVKYLGVLIDDNLSWKHHINYIATKISKGIGIIARLRHSVPHTTLLNINRSLIEPYISYCLVAWGQSASTHLKKIVILQKRVLRLMYFSDYISHSAPLFACSRILPIKCFTSNWLTLRYITSKVIVLLPIFLNFLLTLNVFFPTLLVSQ